MYLSARVQIHPDKIAFEKLREVSCLCKDLWNALLEQRLDPNARGHISYYSQKKELPALKRELPEFKAPCSQVLQEVVKSHNAGWQMFFTKRRKGDAEVRPPRFKSYKYFFSQKYPQRGISFEVVARAEESILRLAYGNCLADWIEIALPYMPCAYDHVKNVVVSYENHAKKWYASLVYEEDIPESVPVPGKPHTIYFDPGCKTALTGIKTDGTVWEYDLNPLRQLNIKHYRLIDRLKSERDHKKKGSRQWRRLSAKSRALYRKINTQTRHYLHKTANRVLDDHPNVGKFMIGDWDKRKTLADTGVPFINRRINRQVQNNNPLGILFGYLKYKAMRRGQGVDKFDERGTTRTCSKCDHVHKEGLDPGQRIFHCEKCSFIIERDINSTLNFLKIYQYAV